MRLVRHLYFLLHVSFYCKQRCIKISTILKGSPIFEQYPAELRHIQVGQVAGLSLPGFRISPPPRPPPYAPATVPLPHVLIGRFGHGAGARLPANVLC